MNVTQTPIDEFKVGDVVVVAFEYKPMIGVHSMYQFAVIKEGKQVSSIDLIHMDVEDEPESYCLTFHREGSERVFLYQTYITRPSYEATKSYVILIATNKAKPLLEIH